MPSTTCPLTAQPLAFYLTYQFIPKPVSDRFPKACTPSNTLKHTETTIANNLFLKLNSLIKASLKKTKGPIGLLLSGGLDSAALLHLLRENTDGTIYTLSAAYASDRNHLKMCAGLARTYKTIHRELIITPEDLLKLPEFYTTGQKSPIGDNGLLPAYLMFQALSSDTKIIYTGDGADCLFHGLKAHYLDLLDRSHPSSSILAKKLHAPKSDYPEYGHYKFDEIFLTSKEAKEYLGWDFDLAKPYRAVVRAVKEPDPLKRTILTDLNFLVANRVDYILQTAWAHKVHVQLPYQDLTLINFALRIPSQYFLKGSEQKYILKKAFQDKLPPQVLAQPKKGMTPPFLEWYTKNHAFVLQTLAQAKALGIPADYIRYLIGHIRSSDQYAWGMRIWLMLNLVHWYKAQEARREVRP